MNREDEEDVYRMVHEIHGDVKAIEQHLSELNGAVARNRKVIDHLDRETSKNSKKIYMAGGAVTFVYMFVSAVQLGVISIG